MGGIITDGQRRARNRPGCYEGRIRSLADAQGRVYVTSRPLTGDAQRLGPCPGADPKVIDTDAGLDLLRPVPGDRCWIAVDETSAAYVIVAWEPI